MDRKIERFIKREWYSWGTEKPWYCHKCDIFLNREMFDGCDGGTGLYKPTNWYTPIHKWIPRKKPVTFEQFCNISYKWRKGNKL